MSQPSDQSRRLTIFLAEDDVELRSVLALLLRGDGFSVIEEVSGKQLMTDLSGLDHEGSGHPLPVLVVTDLMMPGADSLSVLRALKARGRCPPFVLMTGFGDVATHREAYGLGAVAVLDKPFDFDQLRAVVRRVDAGLRAPGRSEAAAHAADRDAAAEDEPDR